MIFGNWFSSTGTDRCLEMLSNPQINPFNITKADLSHTIPNIEHVFRRELLESFDNSLLVEALGIKSIIKSYVFNMVESYYNNAGYVPSNIVDEIVKQVYSSISNTPQIKEVGTYEELRYEMYYSFLHK